MTNILIGVGGTGAKSVEAALVLLAAGIGSGPVYVGLVDQDGANGNVERTRELLARFATFRALWSKPNAPNRVDWSAKEGAPLLGSIDIRPLFDKPEPNALWTPTRTESTLREIAGTGLPDGMKPLFDMLFMPGPEEQDLPLSRGYRGRAHVGAAALTAALVDDDGVLLSRLNELMNPAGGGTVNVFLVGSAFGGTGAAGFPTLARRLHLMRNKPTFANREGVRIGGLLMLPYFSFDDPDEEADAVVTADELMPKAQLALEYYDNLFEHENTLDCFYLLGSDPILPLGYHESGSRDQCNPALPPELVAATSIVDFFTKPRTEAPADASAKVTRMASARDGATIKWADLPGADNLARLGQLLRFAVYWRYRFEPQLDLPDRMLSRNWARKLAEGADPAEFEDELGALRALLDDILEWAATVEHMGSDKMWSNGPWTLRPMLARGHEPTPVQPVALVTAMEASAAVDAFEAIVRFDNGDRVTRTGATVFDELAALTKAGGEHKGLGQAVAAVYAAARLI